jgi:CubicO group peptidase (beta-lactamase class C family)
MMQHKIFILHVCAILLVLTACTPAPIAIPPEVISDLDTQLAELAEQKLFTGSVLVGRQGDVLLSEGYWYADRAQQLPNTGTTRFRIGSITKQFTAMAILILESQEKLSVNDPVCNYVSDCPTAWGAITIEQVLIHTSGIPLEFPLPLGYATPLTPEELLTRCEDQPMDFQPGEKWSYSNCGYVVLGTIIEKVSGQSYEDFLQETIFTPLNMRDTGYARSYDGLAIGYQTPYAETPMVHIDMSIYYAAGSLYSTVEDLYKWAQALSTERLVPRAALDRMFTPHAKIIDDVAYGYGWVLAKEGERPIIMHTGAVEGFTGILTIYPTEEIVVIVLTNQELKDVATIHTIISKKIFGYE